MEERLNKRSKRTNYCRYYYNASLVNEEAPLLRPQSRVITVLDEKIEAKAREVNVSHPCVSYFLSKEELAKRFPNSFN